MVSLPLSLSLSLSSLLSPVVQRVHVLAVQRRQQRGVVRHRELEVAALGEAVGAAGNCEQRKECVYVLALPFFWAQRALIYIYANC